MYIDTRLAAERQRTMLTHAQELRQARRLRALRRASRRVERARESLSQAQSNARRVRSHVDSGPWS
ncbi:MAG TPA: hypothetical protein VMV17_08505 [Streptosporangiaceae bacterium]|nr:hypothetical protein [Streptosporangiaceae bacterium]